MNFKQPEAQVARWIEYLSEYRFEIEQRPGRYHGNADGLSRRPCEGEVCKQCARIEQNAEEKLVHVPARLADKCNERDKKLEIGPTNVHQTNVHPTNVHPTNVTCRTVTIKQSDKDRSWVKSYTDEEMRDAQRADPVLKAVID